MKWIGLAYALLTVLTIAATIATVEPATPGALPDPDTLVKDWRAQPEFLCEQWDRLDAEMWEDPFPWFRANPFEDIDRRMWTRLRRWAEDQGDTDLYWRCREQELQAIHQVR